MPFIPLLTQAGAAAVVNYAAGSIGQVEITQIGLTNTAFTLASTLTALPGEFKRLALSGDTLGDNVIHLEALDNSADVYSYTGFALYTSAGVLFAVYGQTDAIVGKTAATTSWIVLDIGVTQDQAAAITFGDTNISYPPASTDSQGVVELATVAEAQAGADALRVITPATALAAVLAWIGYTPLNAASYTAADILAKLLTVDGANSGLDAALLAGQPASYYTAIAARLGYTPLDSAIYTAADILAKLLTVDGANSGLDAALLAGQPASYYTAIAARLGYTPLDAASYTPADVLTKLLTVDGSGSGVDGDLWRGQTPAQFLASNFPSGGSMSAGFWQYAPDGNGGTWLRIWGTATTGNGYGDGNTGWGSNFTLPKAFADYTNVSCRAWPTALNVTGVDSDEVVAQLIDGSTARVGSEDQLRTVYYEFYGKGA